MGAKGFYRAVILYIEDVDLNIAYDPYSHDARNVILYIEDVDLNVMPDKKQRSLQVILYIEDVDLNDGSERC